MLQKMRDGAQSLGAKVIAGIICFVLVVFGFGAFDLFTSGEPTAATVNGDEITQRQLDLEVNRRKQALMAQLGADADPTFLDSIVTVPAVLNYLVDRTLLLQTAEELDLVSSQAQYLKELRENPNFQVGGEFDESRFRSALANAGFSPNSYENESDLNSRVAQLVSVFQDTAILTDRELRDSAALVAQIRDIAYLTFEPSTFAQGVEVADSEIEEHYAMHADDFMTKETFVLDYVELQGTDLDVDVEIPDDEIARAYELEREAAGTIDRRRGAHILLEVNDDRSLEAAMSELHTVRERVLAGESFEEIAKEISQDPGSAVSGGDLGFAGRGAFVPEFEEVLWSLEPGELSSPFESDFGVHLVTLLEVENPEYPPLAERADDIRSGLVRERLAEAFGERLGELDELAFEETASLQPLADAFGMTIKTAQGVTRSSGEGIFAGANVRSEILEEDVVENGYNSRAVLVGDQHAIVARLRDRTPAQQQPLADVRETITERLAAQKARDLIVSASIEAREKLESGEPVSKVADDYGLTWQRADAAKRNHEGVPGTVLAAAFKLPRPSEGGRSVTEVDLDAGGRALVMVTRVELGDYGATTESDRLALSSQLNQLAGQRDLLGLLSTIREDASVESKYGAL